MIFPCNHCIGSLNLWTFKCFFYLGLELKTELFCCWFKTLLFHFQQDSSLGSFEGDPVVSEESLTDVGTSNRRSKSSTSNSAIRKAQEALSRHQTRSNVRPLYSNTIDFHNNAHCLVQLKILFMIHWKVFCPNLCIIIWHFWSYECLSLKVRLGEVFSSFFLECDRSAALYFSKELNIGVVCSKRLPRESRAIDLENM